MAMDDIQDPLSMNVIEQWEVLSPLLDDQTRSRIQNSDNFVLDLSSLLYDARYTALISSKFRPILFLLCVRWIGQDSQLYAKLAALAFLINPHEELYPCVINLCALANYSRIAYRILSSFFRNSPFSRTLLGDFWSFSRPQMHALLLAYFRIAFACPHFPTMFNWDANALKDIFSNSTLDNGIRCLAIHCYSLHAGLMEAQREELLVNTFGPMGKASIIIEDAFVMEGHPLELDGWLLPLIETMRVRKLRKAIIEPQDFYSRSTGQAPSRLGLGDLGCVFCTK